jgi:hypothetical protein
MRRKENDLAIVHFSEVIDQEPEADEAYYYRGYRTLAHFYRGDLWLGKKEYDPAIEDFTRVIDPGPDGAKAYSYLADALLKRAEAYRHKEDYDSAIAEAERRPPAGVSVYLRGKPGIKRVNGNIIPDKLFTVFCDEFIFFQKTGGKKGQRFLQAAVGSQIPGRAEKGAENGTQASGIFLIVLLKIPVHSDTGGSNQFCFRIFFEDFVIGPHRNIRVWKDRIKGFHPQGTQIPQNTGEILKNRRRGGGD